MKRVIYGIVSIIFVLFIGILLVFGLFLFGEKDMKNNIMEIAEQKGYDIEAENNHEFCVTEDGVNYFYKNSFGKITLIKICTEVSSKAEYHVVDGIGKITIAVVGDDKFEVALDDTVIEVNNQGKEITFSEHISFVCSSEFSIESIDPNDIVSKRGKADKNYNKITTYFISGDEICKLYERSMEVLKELEK